MMTRKSFFIRWLLVRDEKEQEKSVIDIEHIQSGDSQRVSSLEEANLWMREIDAESAEKKTESEK
jgi:cell division protein FtsL